MNSPFDLRPSPMFVELFETPSRQLEPLDPPLALEKCCGRELDLANIFHRKQAETEDVTLGAGWDGVLSFVLTRYQELDVLARSICASVASLFASRKPFTIKLRVEFTGIVFEITSDAADLRDLEVVRRFLRNIRKDLTKDASGS